MMPTRASLASTQSSSPGRTSPRAEFTHGNRHGLVARTSAHVTDHGQKDRQGNHCGKGILIEGNHTRRNDVEDDIHAQPGEAASGAGQQWHGAELLTADDTAQAQKRFRLALADRLFDMALGSTTPTSRLSVVHHRHPEQMVLIEKFPQGFSEGRCGGIHTAGK
jgi:hypothetical protein